MSKSISHTVRWIGFLAVAGAMLATRPAMGAYVLVDDFESYTTGNANAGGSNAFTANGGPWQPRDGAGNITGSGLIEIQDDGSTQHLAFGWQSGQRAAYRAVTPIADGTSGVYYFQVRSGDATPDQSYGLSDQATATNAGFGDFEVQVGVVDDGNTGNGLFNLVGRNGGSFNTLATGLVVDTWYDVWLVVDNAADTYDVYFGTTGNPNTLGTLVGSNLGFRNGVASNDLVTFMVLDAPTTNPDQTSADLDNIYFTNALIVIPAPAAGPAGLAMLALAAMRRRSRRS